MIDSLYSIEASVETIANSDFSSARQQEVPSIKQRIREIADGKAKESLDSLGVINFPTRFAEMAPIPVHEHLEDPHVTRTLLAVPKTDLRDMQGQLLHLLGKQKQSDLTERLNTLSPLSRALLAAAAFIPYLLKRTFTPRKSGTTRFQLDIKGLKASLHNLVGQPWVDSVSKLLQQRLYEEDAKGRDIISRAILFAQAANDHSLKQDILSPLITLPSPIVCSVAASHANLSTALAALEELESRIKT